MGECPFCGSEVEEDLITFGGPCPKCFADIPGEEAATDPGEDVKAAQARKDQMRTTMRTVLPFALLLPVVAVLGMAALWFGFLKPAPEVVLLDFDELDEYPMPELVAAAPEPAPDDGVVDAADPQPKRPAPSSTAGIGDGGTELQGDAEVVDNDSGGTRKGVEVGSAGPETVDGVAEAGAATGGLDLGLEVSASRRGTVLSDPEAIKKMIGQRMAAQAPRLNACYEKQLKNDENLAGRWRLAFVINTNGETVGPRAEALSGSVAEFESCLAAEIGRWSFQRISRDQPVRKTFTFRPAR